MLQWPGARRFLISTQAKDAEAPASFACVEMDHPGSCGLPDRARRRSAPYFLVEPTRLNARLITIRVRQIRANAAILKTSA